MPKRICVADELVDIDLDGYLEGLDDPSGETEIFDLSGMEVC